jgi:hypothetical protein
MPETTVFLLDIMDSNSRHGPVRELHQENGITNRTNRLRVASRPDIIPWHPALASLAPRVLAALPPQARAFRRYQVAGSPSL